MATQTLPLPTDGLSIDLLKGIIEISTTSTVMYGENGVPVTNTLTITKKSLLKKIFKK